MMNKYNTDLQTAKLNKNGIATTPGWLTIYSIEPEQREYSSVTMEYLQVGVGLPALSYIDKPAIPDAGYALVRSDDGTRWDVLPDYRSQTAYSTENGQQEIIQFIGELPENMTFIPPTTQYDKWDGEQWVTDTDAQHADDVAAAEQQRQALLTNAQQKIAGWQTELQLGIISDADKAGLIAWMNYIKAVQAVNTSLAPDIAWPERPED